MKRRYKLLLILLISFLLVTFLYFCLKKDTKFYIHLGSDLTFQNNSVYTYVDYLQRKNVKSYFFAKNYLYVEDYLELLKRNGSNINYYLKNASLITVNLNTYELNNYKDIDEELLLNFLNNVYLFLSQLRKLNNQEIVLINLYDNNYNIVNQKIKKYCKEFEIKYIEINNLDNKTVFIYKNKTYLNYKGHKKLAELILA